MKEFLIYLFITSVSMNLLFLCFRWLMRKEACFALNRFTLLFIALFSLVIPFVSIPYGFSEVLPVQQMRVEEQPVATITAVEMKPSAVPEVHSPGLVEGLSKAPKGTIPSEPSIFQRWNVSGYQVLFGCYFAGLLVVLGLFGRHLYGVCRLIRRATLVRQNGMCLILLPDGLSTWSIGKYVAISRQDYETNPDEILTHELAHERLGHLYDLIILTLLQVVFWFNPLIHLLKRDMRDIHEYQADEYTLSRGVNAKNYQLLIIRKCVGHHQFALATHFNTSYCQIKKRIAMMNKIKKGAWVQWKSMLYVPVVTLLLMSFGSVVTRTSENTQGNSVDHSLALPQGWFRAGTAPQDYKMGIDPAVKWETKSAATIQSIVAEGQAQKFGTLMQSCSATKYLGKRVRMTGYMKSDQVTGWSGFWFRVDGANQQALSFDNMQDRAIKGTTAWKQYQIVLDVPSDAESMSYGVLLDGSGKVWFSNVNFEVVDDSVPLTEKNFTPQTQSEPTNLDFSK